MDFIYSVFFLILGLILGSFYNVVGLRVPKKTFFSTSRSICPACKYTLRWYELIPVVSFIIQKGRCRGCKQQISVLYPVVESLTGIGFLLAYLYFDISISLCITLCLISLFAIIIVSDLRYMIIPNRILLAFLPIMVVLRVLSPLDPWWSSLFGAAAGYGTVALIILISRGGMGGGDMKLLGLLGILLGFPYILLAFFLANVIGLAFSLVILAKNGWKRKQEVPFGPSIMLGAIVTYLWGGEIVLAYMQLLW
ncbi:prepilin peptidase [Gracilibacillus caseinilyticus]|uniref:Prepilin peptidase n=1 Tax=Gracilibacillus caseinilyticus TaxID=2932256 RepID=A0ABY4ETU6_9BACI|nr:A24 family peptidase [Gracilibacillus caseinilyticus]UOQ47292.1 prepilin peptidase [Gracilibacillus caseinilyticus]